MALLCLVILSFPSIATDVRFNQIELPHQDRVWALEKDQDGFLWIASDSALLVFDGYQTKPMAATYAGFDLKKVRKLHSDRAGVLWFGTKDNGLYRGFNNQVTPVESIKSINITEITESDEGVWIGAEAALYLIDKQGQVTSHLLPSLENSDSLVRVTSIAHLSQQKLLVSTQYHLYEFNKTNGQFLKQNIEGLTDTYINTLYIDHDMNPWVATDSGVYFKDSLTNQPFLPFLPEQINFRVNTIAMDDQYFWFGSLRNGLIQVAKSTLDITKHQSDLKDQTTVAGDTIIAMLLDDTGLLMVSSFQGGLSTFHTQSLAFGLKSRSLVDQGCSDAPQIHGIDASDPDKLWLSGDFGLMSLDVADGSCVNYDLNQEGINVHNPFYPLSSFKDSENIRWIPTTKGINQLEPITHKVNESIRGQLDGIIYFMHEQNSGEFLVGSSLGLYRMSSGQFKRIEAQHEALTEASFYSFSRGKEHYYFATDEGVATLNSNDELSIHQRIQSQLSEPTIFTIYSGNEGQLWVGVYQQGLFKFDTTGNLVTKYDDQHGLSADMTVYSILRADDDLWLGTDQGLARLDLVTDQAHVFHTSDGLQGEYFISGSVDQTSTGMMYFGGRHGFNAFNPDEIKVNSKPPNIVLTQLTRFGKTVVPGIDQEGFAIARPINDLAELELTHKDYVIGFEFAALDFADSLSNQYAFKMEGLDPDWNYVSAKDRKISYSNLAPGDYVFRVKGSNKDGIWNETGKSLAIRVSPAPWLTWWAYSLYVMALLAILFAYIYRKNKANAAITARLRIEVDKQTKALQIQKGKVEELLERKNELFANVSHEFRTPLTLILGPINQLLNSALPKDNVQSIEMINRNANRLLNMIEQILQLAKMSSQEEVDLVPQQVDPRLELLVASFQPLAANKELQLTLVQNDEAVINGTRDVIDVVIGNLISNAIKYTQNGGEIQVRSIKNESFVDIEVTDNGCGLDDAQQVEIFNRFTRLESHLGISGVGIGLSVVEEMLKVNKGSIQVDSEPGKGSTFKVRFNGLDELKQIQTIETNHSLLDRLTNESTTEETNESSVKIYGSKDYDTILIIDDNADMRTLIAETLQHQYHCITVDRGKEGIAQAIKWVPDIVICDVMMPGMDGFQVSRILRSDTRTSHIPLILLTALNDKKSRIKGWRENIDVYLTKPFDAQELIIQLENILVIRNILKKKAGAALKSGKMSMNSGLPKNDQMFVDKFMQMIKKMYIDPNFLRPQMASMMAVSERQLQRKLKALIDKNPLDLLREFRLEQAAESLKEGNQVSITADNCGFNSVTYFSKCFKQRYGVTPKVYQQTCNQSGSKN